MKRAAVGLAGAAMVVAAVVRYPLDPTLSFDLVWAAIAELGRGRRSPVSTGAWHRAV